jgi:hypothetical protein
MLSRNSDQALLEQARPCETIAKTIAAEAWKTVIVSQHYLADRAEAAITVTEHGVGRVDTPGSGDDVAGTIRLASWSEGMLKPKARLQSPDASVLLES